MTFLYNRINYGISIEISMLFLVSPSDSFPVTETGKQGPSECVLTSDPILLGGPSVP